MDATTPTAPSEDVVMEDSDDPQLTIRIPNPKVFMVRQSLWVGHRGKLRCDQCRIHNLKCDRQQPACNQCTWVSGRECKYTPLPTPAHRGVPRCDSCRLRNLKCDRNLPICDQCELNSNPHCVYSPKRRKKQSGLGRSGSKNEDDSGSDAPPEAVAQSIIIPKPKPHISNLAALSAPPAPHLATPYQSPSSVSFSMKHQSGLYAVNAPNRPFRRVQPWSHASFLPLPSIVMQGIAAINAAEMPARVVFETELDQFLAGLNPNIRDTACMSLEVYSNVVKYLSGRQGTQISLQLRNWLDLHHFRSGSTKYSVLLTPRDATFTLERPEEDKILAEYRSQADKRTLEFNVPVEDELLSWWNAYDVVPVRNQIYDLMVYAHRSHGSSNEMFHEIAKLNIANVTWPMVEIFHQLCPYCANARAARPQPPRVKVEENMKT